MVALVGRWYPSMAMQPDWNEGSRSRPARRYVRAPAPVHFPGSAPMPEYKPHFVNRMRLFDCLELRFKDRACIGSSQFVYWDASDPRQCAAPDVFVRLGLPDQPFGIWKVWEHGAPHVAVEIASDDDRSARTWADKLGRYHHMGVEELVRFDAEDSERPLRVWDRVEGDFVERALESPRSAECGPLALYWVVVDEPAYGPMLRMSTDRDGRDLLLTAAEAAERERSQIEAERDALLRRVRELEDKQRG